MKSESLVSNLAKKLKTTAPDLYKKITAKVFQEYSHLYLCFKDVASGDVDLIKLGLDKKLSDEIIEAVKEKFKPQKITISGEIRLETFSSEGLEKIQEVLKEIQKVSETMKIHYLGAGRYKLTIEDFEYKPAEKNLKKVQQLLDKFNDKISKAEFIRE